MKLYDTGVYLQNGQEIIPETAGLCGRVAGACDCGPLSCALIERVNKGRKPPKRGMTGRETRIPKGLVPHRRSGIHRGFSYIAHKRRNAGLKGLRRVHTPPQPPNAHTAAHTPKHGAFRTGGGITTLGAFCAVRKPCAAGCQNGKLCRFWALVGSAPEKRREPAEQRCAHARRCSEASRPRRVALLHCCFLRCTGKLRDSLSLRRRAERKIC